MEAAILKAASDESTSWERTVVKRRFHVNHRISADNAVGQRFFTPFSTAGMNSCGIRPPLMALINSDLAALKRPDFQPDVAVLAAAADWRIYFPSASASPLTVSL